jgi:hypothetical protein
MILVMPGGHVMAIVGVIIARRNPPAPVTWIKVEATALAKMYIPGNPNTALAMTE